MPTLENDLTIFKNEYALYLKGKPLLRDKIYSDVSFFHDAYST
ncbi:hypothetical protein [Butyricimonas sp.]|nr:hypothetical protein [Butyricimonas sp.]